MINISLASGFVVDLEEIVLSINDLQRGVSVTRIISNLQFAAIHAEEFMLYVRIRWTVFTSVRK